MKYYFDKYYNDFVTEEEINPFSPSERYAYIEDHKIRRLIDWVQSDNQVNDQDKSCSNCRHTPPSKKFPCCDCSMQNGYDRWENKD